MVRALVFFLVVLVAGCGTSGPASTGEEQVNAMLEELALLRAGTVNNVANFRISGWQEINNRNLIVTAGLHNHYLVTLAAPCIELPFAFSISLDTRTATLSRGDDVIVNSLHSPRERCQISEITRLVDREDA